jgi:transcriptional regulator with XRE-family HTH domain
MQDNKNGGGFSTWLARTMELRGVSGRQIARALKKDEGQVSQWKNGKSVPSTEECLRLGTILEVESPLRLLVNAGIISDEMAAHMGLKPLPIPEYDPERERMKKKIKSMAPREAWDGMLDAWEQTRKEQRR